MTLIKIMEGVGIPVLSGLIFGLGWHASNLRYRARLRRALYGPEGSGDGR